MSISPTLRCVLLAYALSACASSDPSNLEVSPKAWQPVRAWEQALSYPPTAQGDTVDVYHGVSVSDPYRWLEQPDSAESQAWIQAQNELTFGLLDVLPTRERRRERLEELWNSERYSAPQLRGERHFYTHNDGLQDQGVLYVSERWDAKGRVLLDPNALSEDGTIALADIEPSPDGSVLAYATSDGGSDWRTWRFLDVESGEPLPDLITRNKFGGLEWLGDEKAVCYTRYERAEGGAELRDRNLPGEICLHTMGTLETADSVIRERPEAGRSRGFQVSTDGQALVIFEAEIATRNSEVEIVALNAGQAFGTMLVEGFDAQYDYIGSDGPRFWFRTNLDAPSWRIVEIPLLSPQRENWRELVPEAPQTLQTADALGGRLVLSYLQDACARIEVLDPKTEQRRPLPLSPVGTVWGFSGEFDSDYAYYTYSDFTTRPLVQRVHLGTLESEPFRAAPDHSKGNSKREPGSQTLVTKQVFYDSPDGTRIPMFLVHRKGLELDGQNPTLLYGYGGFNISMTPSFSVSNLVWIEAGGVYAVACLRGGGEYGEDWHQAGTKLNKQDVFDDFIAAAEWLVDQGYTQSKRLAIAGGSNGGLLVGACMTQRPELFGACLPAVGVMDMLRYQLFTIGWAWAGDYGTVADEAEFAALYAYSPLHNLKPGTAYPATLITTAERDDRVVPAHSFKFAARLQQVQAGPAPVLIRIETRAGHGAGKPTAMQIDEAADRLAFLDYALGMPH